MKCMSCNKETPEDGKFCKNCGAPIGKPRAKTEWEYKDFTVEWEEGNRSSGWWGMANGSQNVKVGFWDEYQRDIFIRLQKWLDDGWEPITPVNSSCLEVREVRAGFMESLSVEHSSLKKKWELIRARVAMRRQK